MKKERLDIVIKYLEKQVEMERGKEIFYREINPCGTLQRYYEGKADAYEKAVKLLKR